MGLQPCGLIADHRIAGGVALIERIFCEICHFIENVLRRFRRDTIFHTAGHFIAVAVDEFLSLLGHDVCLFLTHGTAHQVASAKAVARQVPHDLHDLFLIHDTAIGIVQDRFQLRVGILHVAAGVFPFDIFGDKVHGPGAVQGDTGDQILQAAGLQLLHKLLHAAAFQLEHAFRFPLADHIINRRVIFRKIIHIQLHAVDTLNFLHRRLDDRQGAQAQEVHFQKPQFFQQGHGVLGIDLPIVGGKGHIFHNRLPTNDNARRMGGRMAGQAFQTQGGVDEALGVLLLLVGLPQVRVHFQRFFDGDAQFCRYHLGNAVHIRIGHGQSTAHILDGRPCRHGTKGDDLGHVFLAIFSNHIIDDLLPSFVAEVDINIGHADTLGI